MANIETHRDYRTPMFYISKSAGMIFTLNQYDAETNTTETETVTYGEALSHNYHQYKYELCSEYMREIANRIYELLMQNKEIFKNCNCIVAVPSHRFKPIVQLIADKIKISYIDALEKTECFYMKKIEPISERKNKTGFISCKYDFEDNDYILLIDDFVDSGTTFRECLNAIKKKNPNVDIVCISVFRTEKTQVELE